jgi:hypothetical protein
MRSEGGSEGSAGTDAGSKQRPASNLLLIGTVLSLGLAVSALVGLFPDISGPATAPPAGQVPTDRVAAGLGPPGSIEPAG